MESSHSLTLNEEALSKLPSAKKPLFVYEWLVFLDNILLAAQKSDIKECQKKIVEQLLAQVNSSPGPPIRQLIGHVLATLFSVGDAFLLFETINKLNDVLKSKDDSQSYLSTRLAAITTLGSLYEKLGRMAGRSYEETVQVLIRGLKNGESQTRAASLLTLEKLCMGMGSAASNQQRDIMKACKLLLSDRNMSVRAAAAKCMWEVMKHSSNPLQLSEFEAVAALSFRALEGSNHEVRCAVAYLLGNAAAAALTPHKVAKAGMAPSVNSSAAATQKTPSIEEIMGVLSTGFLRGGGGFLKGTGEMIKGPAATSREVRVGVTISYIIMVQQLGSIWLERHLTAILQHLLDLAAQPRAAPTHVDAVYSRQCIAFVLRTILGKMLGEKQQSAACKELARLINQQMNAIDPNPENAKDSSTQETIFSQHLLVVALQELGALVNGLASAASPLLADQGAGVIDCAIAVLLHPSQAARLAAAWSLQSMATAVPSHLTLLIDKCVDALENLRSTPEAVSGYSAALAALIAGVSSSSLGIPHNRGKVVFNTAEELLRSASQNNRLAVQRTQAGWLLIGSVMTLGVSVVSSLVPRMLLLWRNSFPRSAKELESEKARGDAFTWQVALEGRAGALSSICSFLRHCPQLANSEDITKRLMGPLDAAITMLTSITSVVKTYGQPLKAACAMVRLRLYDALSLIPPQYYEASYTQLLRLLVAEFTLAENPANTTTSLLEFHCQPDDAAFLLHPELVDSDYSQLQQQLLTNSAAGSGALEHDPCSLYSSVANRAQLPGGVPGPLPLGVAVIDASIVLFGHVFPRVLQKHRLQLLHHFEDSIKQAKTRQAVQTNIFGALLAALRAIADAKTGLGNGGEELRKGLFNLIQNALINPNCPSLRCAAAEAMGRLAQIQSQNAADQRFVNEAIQTSFEKLKNSRDAASRTGHSVALSCLHRYGGGLGLASSQQLNTTVSILMALSQDSSSAIVQHWALHALASIGETCGPAFRPYADSCLNMTLQLLLTVPPTHVEVLRAVGRCCAALVTAFGPELQGNTGSINNARSALLSACALMQRHESAVVQSEAIFCLQQLHMFAPRHVDLRSLVPILCCSMSNPHLGLRRSAVSCLRQLVQREAREVCEHASVYVAGSTKILSFFNGSEQGLPAALYFLLDCETDPTLQRHLRDTLTSLLTSLGEQLLSSWLTLFKDVLAASADSTSSPVHATSTGSNSTATKSFGDGESAADDDEEEFHANGEEAATPSSLRPAGVPPPRWPTRVFAAQSAGKLLQILREGSTSAHFDLAEARRLRSSNGSDYLVLHLSDLIRLAFIAATSDCDGLRMEGLCLLKLLIDCFASQQEPEFPGHSILEQYQAQVSAALRPAFSADTAPNVTAAACRVCSTWMCCGVAQDPSDLRRVQQLLLSALNRISAAQQSTLPPLAGIGGLQQHRLYNESAATLENLSVIKAWAEVYIASMKIGSSPTEERSLLLQLVKPELAGLASFWLAALKDHALLNLPPEFGPQLPPEGGTFYTHDTVDLSRPYYKISWPPLLQAAALWLGYVNDSAESAEPDNAYSNHFFLVFGISLEALCDPKSNEPDSTTEACLLSLQALLQSSKARMILTTQKALAVEVCNVLHRVVLTKQPAIQELAFNVLLMLVKSAKEKMEQMDDPVAAGEGGPEGELLPGTSLVFASLEVCLCLLVQVYPNLDPNNANLSNNLRGIRRASMGDIGNRLVAATLEVMSLLPSICSPQGALSLLPTLLHLVCTILKELKSVDSSAVQLSLRCLRTFSSHSYSKLPDVETAYGRLLQSCAGRLLDWGKAGQEEDRLDPAILLSAVTEMLLHAPAGLMSCPALLYPCLNAFQQSLQSSNSILRLHTIRLFGSLLQNAVRQFKAQEQDRPTILRPLAPYVHALAPKIVANLFNPAARLIDSQYHVLTTTESLTCLEALASLTEAENSLVVLQLLVPILVGSLLDSAQIKQANQMMRAIHSHSLQTLTRIGTKHPQEFKTLLSHLPDLRVKLESAARANQPSLPDNIKGSTVASLGESKTVPTIKLKTDFSNFSSK